MSAESDVNLASVHPEGWKPARGYSNGVIVSGAGRFLFVAGQVAWDADQRVVGAGDFAAQFARALENVVEVVRAAGGDPAHVARLTIYVTDKAQYVAAQKSVGEAYRRLMGRHFPAMALVEVAGLLEDGALVEIEATAALP